ncbi:hypothetical protein E4U17_003297 [Claviceps sp. LM77 group G4]|nr:hypothetical protein E4U17_003297 [Claviceps sp. LM77 group G4]KAG6071986.1 hypothetical protein E4U33_003417 [Claviceps sp. LM78 group G4]KAG6075856.1 hypothetical protein E4U16_003128 [Claviceps sp. LM84 group G4]
MPGVSVAPQQTFAARGLFMTSKDNMVSHHVLQHTHLNRVRDGLALFAVLVILRFLVQRLQALTSKKPKAASRASQLIASAGLQPFYHSRPPFGLNDGVHSGKIFNNIVEKRNRELAREFHAFTDQHGVERIREELITRTLPASPCTPPPSLRSTAALRTSDQPYAAIDRFMHQPNPDYSDSVTSTMPQPDSTPSLTTTKRRSYHRGFPMPRCDATHRQPLTYPAPAPFYPYPYGPISTVLPAPSPYTAASVGHNEPHRRVMDVEGEITSGLDDEGTEWTRHTRVYGRREVCRTCAKLGEDRG